MGRDGDMEKWIDREGYLFGYGFFRIILGFMLWRHAWLFLENSIRMGHYTNRFYLPYFDWYPVPSEAFYIFLLVTILVCGAFLIFGYKTKEASLVAFAFVTFHFFLNQIWYRHNRYFFILLLLLLLLGPGQKIFSILKNEAANAMGKLWSFYLVRLQMTFTYLASAIAKTLDPNWRSGNVLQERINNLKRGGDEFGNESLPSFATGQWNKLMSIEEIGAISTFFALAQEYFLGICLWIPKTRKLALWVGLVFHGSIEVGSHVLVFSYATLATYFLVINPTIGDRTFVFNPKKRYHLTIAKVIYYLDWLNKISIREAETSEFYAIDRDGKSYRGWMAPIISGSCLVLPYILAYPLSCLKHLGVGRTVHQSNSEEKPVQFDTIYMHSKVIMGLLISLVLAYHTLVYAIAADWIGLSLKDLRYIDLTLIFVIFFIVVSYYRTRNSELRAS